MQLFTCLEYVAGQQIHSLQLDTFAKSPERGLQSKELATAGPLKLKKLHLCFFFPPTTVFLYFSLYSPSASTTSDRKISKLNG